MQSKTGTAPLPLQIQGRCVIRPFSLIAIAVLFVLIGTAPADAHRLKVFASGLADRITGYGYFTGGGRAAGAEVVLATLGGAIIARDTSDQQGAFQFTVTLRQDYQITMDTGDGHIATFIISAAELADTLPVATPEIGRNHPVPAPSATVSAVSSIDQAALAGLIEQAVAKQIIPFRAQLDAYEARLRLHDILGGIGWIVGLCGLGAFWMRRRR